MLSKITDDDDDDDDDDEDDDNDMVMMNCFNEIVEPHKSRLSIISKRDYNQSILTQNQLKFLFLHFFVMPQKIL